MLRLIAITALSLAIAPAFADDGFRPLTEWRSYAGTGIPASWVIADGVITHKGGDGDLVSVETFTDFELDFDWKISPGGNSGVMFRVDERYPAPYQSGPEYQILDNAGAPDAKSPLTSAASDYGLYAPSADLTLPVGQWNAARLIVSGNHVEHWLNGKMVVSYELGSPDWKARVANSKFAAWPEYGVVPTGHIDLQDHPGEVSFRNLMIKPLP